MNKNKVLIFSIAMLLIILIIIVLILAYIISNNNEFKLDEGGTSIIDEYAKVDNSSNISRESYADINICIAQYLNTINIKNSIYYGRTEDGSYSLVVSQDEIKQNIYNLLSKTYISKNNISVENVHNYVKTLDKQVLFVPLEASTIQDAEIKSYLVKGLIESLDMEVIDEILVIVNIDIVNNIFSIEPIEGEYDSISEIKVQQLEKAIEENDNNVFSTSSSNYESIVKDYINLYKRLSLGSPETMYNLLDKEYREAKFGDLENFKNYVQTNKQQIIGIRAEKYQKTKEDNYTQYVCIDQYGNYYIFKENAVLDYSVILDTYTIDLPEFIEQYEVASNEKKVGLNMKKILEALKANDYKYIYNKLDETFKNNNFATEEAFENYFQKNFANNEFEYNKCEKNGELYLCDITNKEKTIKKTFVIKLLEGTDYICSFNVE